MDTYIIIVGNPVDGFTHYGPFDSDDAASTHAGEWFDGEGWWVVRLTPTDDQD